MERTLKNISQTTLETVFRSKHMVFPKKHSLVFNMDKEEDAALYKHWTEIYENILIDITDNIEKYKQGGDLK